MSPVRSVGTGNCVTPARKLSRSIGRPARHGATIRSHRNPATNISVLRCPCGTLATSRLPLRRRPCVRVMFVFAQVSSMKIRRPGAIWPCHAFHCSRLRATSGRFCSAGTGFFESETGTVEEVPDPAIRHVNTTPVQFRQWFAAGDIGLAEAAFVAFRERRVGFKVGTVRS
jgi:hypothetical protein